MITSLGLPNRAMFVSGAGDAVDGFIIAQPGSPLYIPPAHDAARVGLIDDFYAAAFEGHVSLDDRPAITALIDARRCSRQRAAIAPGDLPGEDDREGKAS